MLIITFTTGTSDDETTEAVNEIEGISKSIKVGGMSAMSLDMRRLVESQTFIYVIVAVICCLIVLMISLDSYLVPLILLINIGVSILYNMGTNIIFGQISYITKAIAAVAGSSLTTIAGFLALCSMKFSLGKDIGLVMAKGVVFGVITVLTIYPSLLLIFDKWINKSKHKPIIPKFKFLNSIVTKSYKRIFIIFLILLIYLVLNNSKLNIHLKHITLLKSSIKKIIT